MTLRMTISAATLVFAASAVEASTPAAWNQMNQRANRACVAMSGLSRPLLLARKISFSDVIGIEIRQLRGVDSRGRMKRLLCAYNRASGQTEIQEGDNWLGPTVKP